MTIWVLGDGSPRCPAFAVFLGRSTLFLLGCPTALTLMELFAPPPVFSAVNVINVLSNVFSRNCDYAQGISKLFTVITGKRFGENWLHMWSEL